MKERATASSAFILKSIQQAAKKNPQSGATVTRKLTGCESKVNRIAFFNFSFCLYIKELFFFLLAFRLRSCWAYWRSFAVILSQVCLLIGFLTVLFLWRSVLKVNVLWGNGVCIKRMGVGAVGCGRRVVKGVLREC